MGRYLRSGKPLHGNSSGQIGVILTLAAATLIGAMALGSDVAVLYYNWMQLQKGADAAVLAGANYLPENASQAINTTNSYAAFNGIKSSEIVSTTVAPDNKSITILVSRTVPYLFARVLGLTTGLVKAASTASVPYVVTTVGGGVQSGGSASYGSTVGRYGLVPIGLDYTTQYVRDQAITLNQSQGVGAGNWGSLALGGVGGSNLRTNIANGYSGPVSVGDWVTTEPGKKVGPVDQGFTDRISQGQAVDPSGTFSTHSLDDPRAIVIPLVDWSTAKGRSSVQVKGFVTVWVDSVSGGQIFTHFISQVIADSVGNPSATDEGARGEPFLIK
jgi:Flp pilus assembly protein TadG